MMKRLLPVLLIAAALGAGAWLALRPKGDALPVTLYCAVDDEVARELVPLFERESGLRVELLTDTEAVKTVGLANRLLEEGRPGRTPRCDVYWNNEPVWTERLAAAGVLAPLPAGSGEGIPAEWRDPEGFWISNGLRARVFIVHSPSVGDAPPSSFRDLAAPEWKGRGAIARPAAGTTLSHMAALRGLLGPEAFTAWFRSLDANGVAFASGNGPVAREVGRGGKAFGFTDTDDFAVRRAAGEPVAAVHPDQGEGQPGTFVLPVTVSLVRGGPNPAGARRLVEWLLSPATEAALSASSYASIPVRPATPAGPGVVPLSAFRSARVDWAAAGAHVDPVLDLVKEALGGK